MHGAQALNGLYFMSRSPKALDQISAGSDFCMNHLCNRTPSGKSLIKKCILADHAFAHALSRVY